MSSSDYWIAWFDANSLKIPAPLKLKYSQALVDNDILDVTVLQDLIDLDDKYLESIGINNKTIAKLVKVFFFLLVDEMFVFI